MLVAASSRSFACPGNNNVFKSTDNGVTWSPTSGLSGKIVNSFAIKGSSIYAGFSAISGSGVWRSSDNGNTWQEVDSPIDKGDKVFVSDNAIIVASDNFIWRSLNDGATWDLVEQFALTGTSSFAGRGQSYSRQAQVLRTSLDNGGSWTFSPFSDGAYSFSSDGTTIYWVPAARSLDRLIREGLGMMSVPVLATEPFGHYCLTGAIYSPGPPRTRQEYTEHKRRNQLGRGCPGLPIGSNLRSMISFGRLLFAGTEADGIYRSSDHGKPGPRPTLITACWLTRWFYVLHKGQDDLCRSQPTVFTNQPTVGATFSRVINDFPSDNVAVFSLRAVVTSSPGWTFL